MSKLYMVVTKDEQEEPLAVGESMSDLSRIIGVNKSSVSRGIRKYRQGGKTKYREVEVDDEADNI